jgi:UDP-glucose 4-epimerase
MKSNKSILIIGANSYIGKSISRGLSLAGFQVIGITKSRNPDNLDHEFLGYTHCFNAQNLDLFSTFVLEHSLDFELVVFCGGVGSVSFSEENPATAIHLDLEFLLSTLATLNTLVGNFKFIYISSAAVYGDCESPKTESDSIDYRNLPSFYSVSKFCSEVALENISRTSKFPIIVLRVGTIFGPNMKKQLLGDVERQISQGANSLLLRGLALEQRDFTHVKNLTEFCTFLFDIDISSLDAYKILNFGTGHAITVDKFLRTMLQIRKIDIPIRYLGLLEFVAPRNLELDVGELIKFGFSCEVEWFDGLQLIYGVERDV